MYRFEWFGRRFPGYAQFMRVTVVTVLSMLAAALVGYWLVGDLPYAWLALTMVGVVAALTAVAVVVAMIWPHRHEPQPIRMR